MTGPEPTGGPDRTAPSEPTAAPPAGGAPAPPRRQRLPQAIIEAILEGRPAVVTALAIAVAMAVGGVLIAFSDPVVLHAWSLFFSAPGNAVAQAWDSAAASYSAMFEGAIFNPHTVTAIFQQASLGTALHDGYISAMFTPLSNTAVYATPLILTGLSVAVAFRAGLFNIGAAGQWIGGAIVATWLGFAVSLPLVVHAVVCVLGGIIGGAAVGWVAGVLKARTGAHEVIVTIMFNYVMYNLLSFLLGTPTALQLPHQANLQSPNIASDAQLPHLAGPTLRVNAGFLVALAAAAAVWWLLSRSTTGFEFRAVGANPSAARSAGMSVERTWILTMLIAGGLAGLAGSAVIQGTDYYLTFQSYGTYGFDGITVALLGRAKPLGVVLAALLFGALHAGGVQMGAVNQTPVDVVTVIQALIVLFVAAPPMIRALFRLRAARAPGIEAVAKGWNA